MCEKLSALIYKKPLSVHMQVSAKKVGAIYTGWDKHCTFSICNFLIVYTVQKPKAQLS